MFVNLEISELIVDENSFFDKSRNSVCMDCIVGAARKQFKIRSHDCEKEKENAKTIHVVIP